MLLAAAGLHPLRVLMVFAAMSAVTAGAEAFTWPGLVEAAARDLQARDPARRLAAVESLSASEDEPARALLRATLRDPDRGLRLAAARILARRGDTPGIEAITEWLGNTSASERAAALEALRLAPRITPAARRAIERTFRDQDGSLKLAALAALEREPGPSAVRVATLLEDPRPAVRLTAARLVGMAGDRRVTVPLLARLADVDLEVQRQAVRALGRLRDRGAGPALLTLLDHGPDELRGVVIDALGSLRLPAAVPALATLARRRPADPESRQALRALGEIGTREAIGSLLAELERGPLHPDLEEALARHARAVAPWVREALDPEDPRAAVAARLAGSLRLPDVLPALQGLLRLRGPAAVPALQALVAIGDRRALPALVEAATDGEPRLRRAAVDGLLALADPRSGQVLAACLRDADPHLRLRALELARRIGAADAAGDILRALNDPVPAVAVAAVEAVQDLSLAGAAPALLAALPRLPGHEAQVGRALRRVAEPADLSALLRRLPAASGDARLAVLDGLLGALARDGRGAAPVRTAALEALRRELSTGGPGAELAAEELERQRTYERSRSRRRTLVLSGQLADEDQPPGVRAAAAWALAGTPEPAAREALRQAAQSATHPAVADNARAALAQQPPIIGSVAVRLQAPPGISVASRWLQVAWAGGGPIWVRTGSLGQAHLPVPAQSALRISLGEVTGDLAGLDPSSERVR